MRRILSALLAEDMSAESMPRLRLFLAVSKDLTSKPRLLEDIERPTMTDRPTGSMCCSTGNCLQAITQLEYQGIVHSHFSLAKGQVYHMFFPLLPGN